MISELSKSKEPFRSENVVNYCITSVVFSAGRKAKALDEFGGWAPGIIKKINKSFEVSFYGCAPMHAFGCLTNMMQIYE